MSLDDGDKGWSNSVTHQGTPRIPEIPEGNRKMLKGKILLESMVPLPVFSEIEYSEL